MYLYTIGTDFQTTFVSRVHFLESNMQCPEPGCPSIVKQYRVLLNSYLYKCTKSDSIPMCGELKAYFPKLSARKHCRRQRTNAARSAWACRVTCAASDDCDTVWQTFVNVENCVLNDLTEFIARINYLGEYLSKRLDHVPGPVSRTCSRYRAIETLPEVAIRSNTKAANLVLILFKHVVPQNSKINVAVVPSR